MPGPWSPGDSKLPCQRAGNDPVAGSLNIEVSPKKKEAPPPPPKRKVGGRFSPAKPTGGGMPRASGMAVLALSQPKDSPITAIREAKQFVSGEGPQVNLTPKKRFEVPSIGTINTSSHVGFVFIFSPTPPPQKKKRQERKTKRKQTCKTVTWWWLSFWFFFKPTLKKADTFVS